MKFWQRLFTAFLKRFHLMRFFGRNRSFKELHQSSYAQEISESLSKRLLNASRVQTNDLLKQFDTHLTGLTEEQAYTQQMTVGLNEVTHEKPLTWWQHLWYCYRNPFNILLSLLALIAFFTDDLTGSTIISVMVILSTLLRYWQEAKSNQAADALKAMVSNTATVLRHQVSAEDLELMHERYGIDTKNQTPHQFEIPIQYLVPGDVILLSAGDMIPADCRILSAKDLFVSQAAMTGESMPVEKFPLQKNLEETSALELDNIVFMGTNIVSGSAQAVVLSTGIQTYFGALAHRVTATDRSTTAFQMGVNKISWLLIRFMLVMAPVVLFINGFTKGDWAEAFLFALSVAVGLTPEMLPMIVTSTLAKGAVFLSKKKVIVKRLDAIQNFGAMDVLCTDKTGTLTQDKIFLSQHIDVQGGKSDFVLMQAFLNSYYQTGLKNLLDVAVLEAVDDQIKIQKLRYKKLDEVPFDFDRRRMSVVVQTPQQKARMITKGAVEEMLKVCRYVEVNGKVEPLTKQREVAIEALTQRYNRDGLRVVAVAYREFKNYQENYSVVDESDLILIGYITFLDPPKESAKEAVQRLHAHGVTVKVLTGDNEFVTQKVCREIGLNYDQVLLGGVIETLTDQQLKRAVEQYHIFAKLSPVHKERIVEQLKANGHVVGFLGDGINDAAAIRAADIGISVDTAVDIAKESADLILLEKSLMVLEKGVIEGRRTFANMLKYIKMTASSNFGNVFSVLIASAFIPFLPMLPIHLLIQNLLYDVSQIVIPFDNVDEELIAKPQRWQPEEVGRFMVVFGPISSIFDMITFGLMWFVFSANTPEHQTLFQSGWFVVGLLTQTLIVHMIRTAQIPFIQSRAATPLLIMTAVIMCIGIFLPMGPLASYLKLQALPLSYFLYLPVILGAYMCVTQWVKKIYIRRYGWQ
ncbi:magnesium-translocating P-type ATPase [Acinetobacter baumannii 25493_8]|uniref:magnesium-translocating P-type ATPase n=1 Tax=Acinetobacter baumannii TaxID=470 RepID=UPI0002B9DA3A|nr:magnesium-translocating P-type ATPase [Acinetobacter baumannii]EYD53488.1 magnesium-translocating P-type ATPase [Acinetobacter baumannii 25493_4]EYS11639.1 magnesium-translocating P-type ATPase [Acinetobacter baumannii 25569_7]EHU2135782.1 magnesium-translocating P-type ATPase [Acinetobacter baumannii]EIG0126408.1 magnesium-translocating P-type ATPase [Acinetobacter baumannii]EIY0852500.1 magnesium-translocating P-type ATPase [Acinetobacter baumannii]